MDGFLYTFFALITSAGSATIAYVIMNARLRAAVAEERSRCFAAQAARNREELGPAVGEEQYAPQLWKLLDGATLLENHTGHQILAMPLVKPLAAISPNSGGVDVELPAGARDDDLAAPEPVSDERSGRERRRHSFAMDRPRSRAGLVRSHLKRRNPRWRPRIR
jgi:hypothetical protein